MTTARDTEREAIRAALSDPWRVIRVLGLDRGARREGSGFKAPCPWCGGGKDTPPLSVRVRDGKVLAHCFSCGSSGDVFSLVAAVEGITLPAGMGQALARAAALANLASTLPATLATPTERAPRETARADAASFHRGAAGLLARCPLLGSVSVGLASRGVLPEAQDDGWGELPANVHALDIGQASEDEAGFTTDDPGLEDLVTSLEAGALRGFVPWLWSARGDIARPSHRLLSPWRTPDGRIWNVQRRWAPRYGDEAAPDGTPKYVEPAGAMASAAGPHAFGIERLTGAAPDAEVWVCEGAMDVLALRALNHRGYLRRDRQPRSLVAVGLPGVSAWRRVRESLVPRLTGRVVRLALDGDKAGAGAVRALAQDCRSSGAASVTDKPPPREVKDWAELTARYWKEHHW